MMFDKLFENFSTEFFGKIASALKDSNLTGFLDGVPFESISVKGTGRKAFVIKGWVKNSEGPAVRYRAAWKHLSGGEFFYDPDLTGWRETEELGFDLNLDIGEFALVGKFQEVIDDPDGTNENMVIEHEVKFVGDIEIPENFRQYLS